MDNVSIISAFVAGLLNRIAGAFILIFGLHVAGLFQSRFLNYEKRFNTNRKPVGILSTYLAGLFNYAY